MKSQPIKDLKNIEQMKQYFIDKKEWRNYALFIMGLNTALRISDLLVLKWGDVYYFDQQCFKEHIIVIEKKTKKRNVIALNDNIKRALEKYKGVCSDNLRPEYYIFSHKNNQYKPIQRNRAYTIIRKAAQSNNLEGIICCHSLRKSFGYHAWRKGVPPAIIMDIYNHSSLETTKRYLSIDQDERDEVFRNILL